MKKSYVNIWFLIIIVIACGFFIKNLFDKFHIDKELLKSEEYTSLYYYNQLTEEQKIQYVKIDQGIQELEQGIHFGFVKNAEVKSDVIIVLAAIYNDRPEYYYLPQDYNVKSIKLGPVEYTILKLNYTVRDKKEREMKDLELDQIVEQIVYDATHDQMTDYEKELALHDALVKKVNYFEFENIEKIPVEKHTAYEALVNNSAVCDGISKAYQLLLKKAGIYSIMVTGKIGEIAHAWNIVKVDGEYYHVDPTSNAIEVNGRRQVMHRYFNLSDKEFKKTHTIDKEFPIMACESTKYDYYTYNNFEVKYTESLRSKLIKIINKQLKNDVIEFRLDKLYSTQTLLEELYYINFNKWEDTHQSSVAYHKIDNIYVFENKNTKRLS
ncbi:MAG: hypothetical protein IKL68_03920 [Clostridia bacterium]|nr:hypothetical protein [Clostridia bacterium]